MNDSKEDIKILIDKDEGLRSKRKMLTIVSLILLSIEFSGATIVEANTFILKISFEHQSGISLLLLLAIIFLLVRYFNYAKPYHEKLFELWSSRMLSDSMFILGDPYSPDITGLISDLAPNGLDIEHIGHDENSYLDWSYQCKFFLNRYIKYSWFVEHIDESASISLLKNVSFFTYIKVLMTEFKYQVLSFFSHRENLDILAPYLLGVTAIFSYFFNAELQHLIFYLQL